VADKDPATRIRELEAELAQTREILGESERITSSGAYHWELSSGAALWSEGMFRIYGLSRDGFSGDPGVVMDMVHPEDLRRFGEAMRGVVEEGVAPENLEFRIVRPDGEVRNIWSRGKLLRNEAGEVTHMIGVNHDITDRRRFEEELARSAKLESLGLLAGGLAHDFNNILTGVAGNIELAEVHADDPTYRAEVLDEARRALERAQGLTRQLLTFADGGAPIKRPSASDEIVRETASFVTRGSTVRCDFDLPAGLPMVDADPTQLAQVVHNLVLNAVQAMPEGGTLRIDATEVDVRQPTTLPLVPGSYVRLQVTDDGPGIPSEQLPRVFEPFYSTRPGGRGLGLAGSFSIVHRHGGHLACASELGVGTRFTVWLPVSQGYPATEATSAGPAAGRTAARVLVLDDDPTLRILMRRALSAAGHTVDVVGEGMALVERFRHARDQGMGYDVLVLDLTIPGGLGGLWAIERLRAVDPEVRAVACSGYTASRVMADPESAGFVGALQKPFRLDDLRQAVERALLGDRWTHSGVPDEGR